MQLLYWIRNFKFFSCKIYCFIFPCCIMLKHPVIKASCCFAEYSLVDR